MNSEEPLSGARSGRGLPGPAAVAFLAAATAILIVAAWLRLSGRDWDQGLQLNVDDSFVSKTALRRVTLPPGTTLATLFQSGESPINPRAGGDFFPYGTLPIYVTKAAATLGYHLTGDPALAGLRGVQLTGRAMSALFDLVTLLAAAALAARLWGRAWGLFAGALYAFAILPIQVSHFFITDPFMSAFMGLALLCSVLYYLDGRGWMVLLAGVSAGLAMACKLSAATVLVLPLLAVALRTWSRRHDPERGASLRAFLLYAGLALGGALLGLFLGDPHAVLDPAPYLAQIQEQTAIQNGQVDEWFTRKYVGTWPLLHGLGQLLLLGVGPLVGAAGVLGLLVWAVGKRPGRRTRDERRKTEEGEEKGTMGVRWLLVAGALVYYAPVGLAEAKWVRYLLPLVPYLCLAATLLAVWAWRRWNKTPWGVAIPAALALSAAVGAAAVMPIYRSEHTQIEASRWIYENVPAGASIGLETTAIRMPLALPRSAKPDERYRLVEIDPLADRPSADASAALRAFLGEAEYLVIDNTQAARTVPRLPWRYPVQQRYYDLLFEGDLGFSEIHRSVSYPRVGALSFPDAGGWVDVSFMDSSHPPVYIFRRERVLTSAEWDALFAAAAAQPSIASRSRP